MKKQGKILIYALVAISMIVCAYIGVIRINVEQDYNNVEVAIRYSDVLRIAHEKDMPLEEVLADFKDAGATTLFFRENTILPNSRGEFYNYKEQGKATYYEGYELEKYYPEDSENIAREYMYIETYDRDTFNNIYFNLKSKGMPVTIQEIGGKSFIKMSPSNIALNYMGVGFNYDDLEIAAGLGYIISPQVKFWNNPTPESVQFVVEQLEYMPNLGTIYFADNTIPGANNPYMVELIQEHGLGYVEFFSGSQGGFTTLAEASKTDDGLMNVQRLHTVGDNEIATYSVKGLIDRYMLGLTERNLRTFLFKMPSSMNIDQDIAYITQAIELFVERATVQGFNIGRNDTAYNLPKISTWMLLLAGLGAIGIFVLLCQHLGFSLLGYILGAVGLVGYAVLLKIAPNMASKLMALFGSIIFPTYAVVTQMKTEEGQLGQTILRFLKIVAISFGGALTTVGVLSKTQFGMGVDIFMGVKLVYTVPIVLVVLIMIYKKYGFDMAFYRSILEKKVTYLAVALIGVLGVIFLFYTARTGNSGQISSIEAAFRQMLDTVLGVRPRTTEILIGYPLMLALLYYGYKELYLPILMFAVMGPISLVNTYGHLHTPLMISLIRSVYGVIIGLVVGLILIYVIKFAIKVVNQCLVKIK